MKIVPPMYSAATVSETKTLAENNHSATRGSLSTRLRSNTTITNGHTK